MSGDGGSGHDRHDPLWAVTVPRKRAAKPPAPESQPSDPVVEPPPEVDLSLVEPAEGDLDAHLVAFGITITPAESVVTSLADPTGTDAPTEATSAIGTVDTPAAGAALIDTADLDMGALDTADVDVVDDDTTETLTATGFASDPLAPTVAVEVTEPRASNYDLIGDTGNTAIITTPPLDGTPPGGVRFRARRRRSWRRRILGLVAALVLAGVGYYTISLFQVWTTGNTDHREAADVIAVMGAAQYDGRPSPQLRARLDHAVELYEQGVAPIIFVTGGKQEGDRFTEAEASRDYLIARGVPELAIAMESSGRTTWQSLQNMSGELDALGLDDVVIVTDPYHSLRTKLMGEELGLVAHVSPTRTSPVQGRTAFWHHVKEAAGVAVGRIVGFSRLDRVVA